MPPVNPVPVPSPETPAEARRRRIAEARRQFDKYLDLGAVDPALDLHRHMRDAGEGWRIDPTRLQPIVDALRAEKRWDEAAPLLEDLVDQLQQRINGLRLSLAQIAVKKVDRADLALDALAGLDHRILTSAERDIALEMQGRARRRQLEDDTELARLSGLSDTKSAEPLQNDGSA